MSKYNDYLKSVAIAQAVAACINAEGGIGPFGGETAEASDNQVTIRSQACNDTYKFHADGTVDLLDPEYAYDEIAKEMGYGEEDMLEELGTVEDFVSEHTSMKFEDFMSIDDGWFRGSELEAACIAFVKAIVSAE